MLDDACFFKCFVGAVFCHGAESFCRKRDCYCAVEFWYKNTLLLEVCVLTHLSGWVELGSTNTVAVPAGNLGALFSYWAFFRHIFTENSKAFLGIDIWYHGFSKMQPELIFSVVVLVFSVVLHEAAHGYMANFLGDPTARLQGRLTLNPVSHIDPVGSVFLPALLVFTGSPFLIGWAKPVPYNPYNLPGRFGEALVAAAGPGTNILLALIFGLSIRFFGASMSPELLTAFGTIAFINLLLAFFNLIPFPPLDGSKILSAILPGPLGRAYDSFRIAFESLGIFTAILILFALFYFFAGHFSALLQGALRLLIGL